MMRMAAQLSAAGLAGIVLVKVFGLFVMPTLGIILGILALLIKIALVMFVGYFVLQLFKRFRGDEDEDEIEVEVEEVE